MPMERLHAPEAGEQEEASPHTSLARLLPPEARVLSIREAGVLTFLKHCFDLSGKCRKVKVISEGHTSVKQKESNLDPKWVPLRWV